MPFLHAEAGEQALRFPVSALVADDEIQPQGVIDREHAAKIQLPGGAPAVEENDGAPGILTGDKQSAEQLPVIAHQLQILGLLLIKPRFSRQNIVLYHAVALFIQYIRVKKIGHGPSAAGVG